LVSFSWTDRFARSLQITYTILRAHLQADNKKSCSPPGRQQKTPGRQQGIHI